MCIFIFLLLLHVEVLRELSLSISQRLSSDFEALLDSLHNFSILISQTNTFNLLFFFGQEGNSETLGTEATSTADTVHVGIGIRGHIELDDNVDTVDIDTTSEEIGGDDDASFVGLALIVGGDTLGLVHGGVDGDGGEAHTLEVLVEGFSAVDGVAEDDDLVEVNEVEEFSELLELLLFGGFAVVLGEAVEGELSEGVDEDFRTVLHELLGDGTEVFGGGGGEHHNLLVAGAGHEDLLDVTAHAEVIKAAIELINDEELDVADVHLLLLDEGAKTAGGTDDDGGAVLLEGADVLVLRDTTEEDGGGAVREVLVEALEFAFDLVSKFAGVDDDDGLDGGLFTSLRGGDLFEESEDEDGGLTHTSLGLGEDVTTEHSLRENLVLDFRGLFETVVVDGAEEIGLEAEVLETTESGSSVGGEANVGGLLVLLSVFFEVSEFLLLISHDE